MVFLKSVALLGLLALVSGCSTVKEAPESNPLSYQKRQLQCMAEAINGEARGESEEGKLFVGRVVITRVKKGYGQNYCSVVYAKRQFAPRKKPSQKSLAAALKSEKLGPNGITHFHSYQQRATAMARFSRSPACTYRGKVGGHWGFTCPSMHSSKNRHVRNDEE